MAASGDMPCSCACCNKQLLHNLLHTHTNKSLSQQLQQLLLQAC
jgi:hypothetical protein